ncbi:uncharacterized protein LOC143052369 isoform X3 [Mytilus galloprovincialis]|uniref:uncharacterized protein LOC143052369 isoform X3 n=1 Tax=Mytilus galloprovincialis TaxID=29158 RepID=UPI003F7C650E
MTAKITRSSPLLYKLEVTLPDDEAEIFKAVHLDDIPMLRNQIKLGVDINSIHTGSECMIKSRQLSRHIRLTEYSPLIKAVIFSQIETVEWLVDNGALVNIREGTQRTPLHLAVATDRADVVQYLISKGAELNCHTKSLRTPLLEAVDVNSPLIVDMLIKGGSDLDLGDIKGTTPLLDAAFQILKPHRQKHLNMEVIELLIKGGCAVNKANNLHATPLMMAVGSKSQTVVEVLLNAGADINHVNINKWWYELTTMRFSIAGVPYFKRPSRKC